MRIVPLTLPSPPKTLSLGRERVGMAAFTAVLFVAYLISLSPHLVHHLFDEDQNHPTCPYFALSQQNADLQPDPPILVPPHQTAVCHDQLPAVSLPSSDRSVVNPRAPPRSTPSA